MKIQTLLLGMAIATSQVEAATDMEVDTDTDADVVYAIPKALSAECGILAIVDDLIQQMERQAPINNDDLLQVHNAFYKTLEATKKDIVSQLSQEGLMENLMHSIVCYQTNVMRIVGRRF